MMKKFSTTIAFQVGIYILQYLLLPVVINISSSDTQRILVLIVSTTAIASFVGMYFFDTKLRFWFVGILLYYLLVLLYHPKYVYGIGDGMFTVEKLDIFVLTIIVTFTQVVTWVIVKVIKWRKRHLLSKG